MYLELALILVAIAASLIVVFTKRFYLSQFLVLVNFAIFIVMAVSSLLGWRQVHVFYDDLAYRPEYLYDGSWRIYTIFTYQYVHSGILHVLFNMLFLLFFGLAFEERIGKRRLAMVYFLSGIGSALAFTLIHGRSGGIVGASGSIFGIMGAFAAMYPRQKVVVPIPLLFIFIVRPVRVFYATLFYTLLETAYLFLFPSDGVSHVGHLGGLAAGVFIAAAMTRGRFSRAIDESQTAKSKRALTLPDLEPLASTKELREMLDRIRDEDEPDVQRAWLEHFLARARCPRCSSLLSRDGLAKGRIACGCGWELERGR